MIDLGLPVKQVNTLTLYPSVEKGTWYYLPSRPELRRTDDGAAGFSLIKFRDSVVGHSGGQLKMATQLSEGASDLRLASTILRRDHGDESRLAPMPAAKVRCDFLLGGASIGALPKEHEPFEADFDARLTLEAAAALEASIGSPNAPGALVYWLSCPARRAPVQARAILDGRQVVRALTERAGAGALTYQQIKAMLPTLQQMGAVSIEIADDSLTTLNAVDAVVERAILSNFFESSPGLGPGFIGRDTISPEQLGFETRSFTPKADASGRFTMDLSAPEDTYITLARAATFGELLRPLGPEAAGCIRESEQAPA